MSAPIKVYSNSPKQMVNALLALGTLKVMLATASFTPDQDANDFINDVTNEATGTSYSAGGIAIPIPTVTLDTATNIVTLDGGDITTAGLSVSCRWAIVYVSTGVTTTSPVIAYVDLSEGLGGNVTCTGIQWDAAGIAAYAVAA